MPSASLPSADSPCRQVCKLTDALTDSPETCLGCGRTLSEIADWSLLDGAARQRVNAMAAERLQRLSGA